MKIFNINLTNINSFINQLIDLEMKSFSTPWSKQAFYDSLNNSNFLCFGALTESKQLMAYVSLYKISNQIFINNIAVFDEFKQQGVASALLKHLVENAKSDLAEFITLEVRESNLPAINLYKKMGFIKIGVRKNFYSMPLENALIFTIELNSK